MSRLEEIESFVRIAEAGSISRAAAQRRIAKSAMSRRLADLEARLGVQLFARTTRKLTLTDAGAAFLARARRILADIEEAEAEAVEGHGALSGNLRIAAPLSFGLAHLKPLIADFARRHPKVTVEVDFSDRFVDIVGEGFDVAVRIAQLADSSLIARKLCPVRAVVAAAPAFWRAHGRPRHPRDLAGLSYLAYSNVPRPGAIRYWGPGGDSGVVEPRVSALANNGEFLADIAAGGCGFVCDPTFILHRHLRAGALEAVLTEYEWTSAHVHLVYPPTRQVSARVRAFADAVIEKFGGDPYWDEGLFPAER
ncbi:LysR family transcriptional regulator [Amphiplicatus metriothermophilus]|uniref:DNA-binding transcriptional regulator, LysR family n=1 Tax=Amphiplicatus metriothermophilus TaxID=1519374 RepID=A0A239PVX5_9PROT|nr:LysR family transcriptional regulator [Amphiplicatus metriothermophilus]MBB5519696.1 DNA-binding transcriptional LysR family regulator [Amphiplicatus metriothermophilus]SNT74258.1 DNA-binding transcriptional regulator, LysR family [Amphiplicatus metriothermophilus]